jgi:hypothetical protein
VRRCNFTLSTDYLRERLDFVRLERFERFVRLERLDPRRLEPPVAGAGAVAALGGGAVVAVAVALAAGAAAGAASAAGAAAFPKPNRLDTEFNKVPLEPLDISILEQQFFTENQKIFCSLFVYSASVEGMSNPAAHMQKFRLSFSRSSP